MNTKVCEIAFYSAAEYELLCLTRNDADALNEVSLFGSDSSAAVSVALEDVPRHTAAASVAANGVAVRVCSHIQRLLYAVKVQVTLRDTCTLCARELSKDVEVEVIT